MENFIVNGVVGIIIVTLETRYELSSYESGMIASAYGLGGIPFLIIIGYIGDRVYKPKLMSIGVLIVSIGCFLFALPHFIGGKYQYTLFGERYVFGCTSQKAIKT